MVIFVSVLLQGLQLTSAALLCGSVVLLYLLTLPSLLNTLGKADGFNRFHVDFLQRSFTLQLICGIVCAISHILFFILGNYGRFDCTSGLIQTITQGTLLLIFLTLSAIQSKKYGRTLSNLLQTQPPDFPALLACRKKIERIYGINFVIGLMLIFAAGTQGVLSAV